MIQHLTTGLVVALWVAVVLVAAQVYRAPHDAVLRYVALAFFFLAAADSVSVIHDAALERVVTNLCNIASVLFQVCVFRTALRRRGDPPPRLWKETVVAAAVAAVGIGAWLLTPPPLRATLSQPKNGDAPESLVFVVVIISYVGSVAARTVVWSTRLVRRVLKNKCPETAAFGVAVGVVGAASVLLSGLALVKVSGAIVTFLYPHRAVFFQSLYTPVNTLAVVGFVIFVTGALIPVADGVVRAIPVVLDHRRGYRDFGPLWQALHAAFPKVLLRTQRGVHRRFYRRGMEIRDGLVLLADYYDPAVAERAARESAVYGGSDEDRAVIVVVALIRAALEAHRADRPVPEPYPIPTSGALDWATDTAWLLRVARAFSATAAMTSSPPITTTG